MSMIIRKRQLLMATLIVALGAAVFVNWYYTRPQAARVGTDGELSSVEQANLGDSLYVQGTTSAGDDVTDDDTTAALTETNVEAAADVADFFADAKLKRTQAHDEVLDAINEIINNTNATSEQKNKANVYLSDFQSAVKLETDIENLITAKTGSQCLVSINNGSVEVVMTPGKVDATVTLQIAEIIKEQAEITSENITIIEAK